MVRKPQLQKSKKQIQYASDAFGKMHMYIFLLFYYFIIVKKFPNQIIERKLCKEICVSNVCLMTHTWNQSCEYNYYFI